MITLGAPVRDLEGVDEVARLPVAARRNVRLNVNVAAAEAVNDETMTRMRKRRMIMTNQGRKRLLKNLLHVPSLLTVAEQ
jgi:hypothetical protein